MAPLAIPGAGARGGHHGSPPLPSSRLHIQSANSLLQTKLASKHGKMPLRDTNYKFI